MADPALPRLVVVDDEPLNLELLRRTLQRHFALIAVGNAAEALRELEQDGPAAAVLCDQLMPGMFGTELAAIVRARWPQTRFVLVTGVDDRDDVVAAHRAGLVDAVFAKPWNAAQLRARLLELAGASPA